MKQAEILLELVRAAVLDATPVIPKDVKIDWNALMDSASGHKVLAWVWDSICRLPAEQQPSRQERINWGLSAQEIWDSYYSQKKVLEDMISVCQKEGIRLLLLKGLGVSAIYPKPESRPSGDIDIFLFDDFEKGKDLFGKDDQGSTELHDEYVYKGVLVENHKMFIYPNTPVKKLVGQHLLDAVDRAVLSPEGYYTFAPIDNYVYLMMHALNHIKFVSDDGLYSLKSFVDLAVFFYKYQDSFSRDDLLQLVKKLQLHKSFELIMYFTEWLLGIDCSSYRINLIPNDDLKVIKELFLNNCLSVDISDAESLLKKSKLLWDRYKTYQVVYKYLPKHKTSMFKSTLRRQLGLVRDWIE